MSINLQWIEGDILPSYASWLQTTSIELRGKMGREITPLKEHSNMPVMRDPLSPRKDMTKKIYQNNEYHVNMRRWETDIMTDYFSGTKGGGGSKTCAQEPKVLVLLHDHRLLPLRVAKTKYTFTFLCRDQICVFCDLFKCYWLAYLHRKPF